MTFAYIALGSNLQQPIAQVRQALLTLEKLPQTNLIQASSLYKTAPVGYDNQPDFINAVVKVSTQLAPHLLLEKLLEIEQQFGRKRPFPNAPRILDLDLLMYGDLHLDTDTLILPHPRMHLRGFVILPLAEISPELILPNGCSVVELAGQFKNQGIKKLK